MPNYNLYKINNSDINGLIEKLEKVGMQQISNVSENGHHSLFYLSEGLCIETPVKRATQYVNFLGDTLIKNIKNINYFGCLIIMHKDYNYAIPLGKAHFYLSSYCDLGFGIKLAERICDVSETKMKKAKFFSGSKNKIIYSYKKGTESNFQSGESVVFYKGKIEDPGSWGKIGLFGYSAKLDLDYSPQEIYNILPKIEDTINNGSIKLALPVVDYITDNDLIKKLDDELVNDLILSESNTEPNEEQIGLSGTQIIFHDEYSHKLYIRDNKRKSLSEDINISKENIMKYLVDVGLDIKKHLNDILVQVEDSEGKSFSNSLKCFIEYTNDKGFALIDGKWCNFNQSFLKYLDDSVSDIPLENKFYEETFIKESGLIDYLIEKHGYENGHLEMKRMVQYNVEPFDLYKDNTCFFIKKGVLQKLGYVIDQSITTIKYIKECKKKIYLNKVEKKIDKMCLRLLYDKKKQITNLKEIKSFIFKIKVDNWKKECRESGIEPMVYITYI